MSLEHIDAPFIRKQQTWIDKRGRTRQRDGMILCLGLSRTGTSSLRVALWNLGYDAYHGWNLFENPPDCNLWMEAMRAKFEGVGTPWGRKEFDQIYCDSEQVFRDKNCYHRTRLHSAELTSSHSAVLDVPSSAFAKELIAAYPEAKVILTVRDNVDVWYKSCCNTIVPASLGVGPKLLSYLDPVCALHGPTLSKYMYNFYGPRFTEEAATRRYRDHIAEVRRLVPEQNYLEFNVKRGWAPLCDFLGRDVPPTPFPRVNDTESFNDIFGPFFKDLLLQRMREWALWGAALGAVGVAIYWAALKR